MVEGEGIAFLVALEHQLRQLFVLIHHHGQVFAGQLGSVAGRAHHGLHAQFLEAQIQHHFDILEEIGVGMGEGTAHVVFAAFARLNQLLELGHDLIPAALAGIIHTVAVMDLLAAVEAEHHVAALTVGKVDHVVVDEHAVGGEGEAEVLARFLFTAARIGYQLLDHVEVHQRLAAEKVHLEVAASAGIFNQKIQSLLAHFETHHGAVAVVLALRGEAIGAVEIAGVGYVHAQRFHHACSALLELPGDGGKGVRRKQHAGILERADLIEAFFQFFAGHFGIAHVLFKHRGDDILAAVIFIQADDVVGDLVHQMHGTGVDVQHDVLAAKFISVNHGANSFKNESS